MRTGNILFVDENEIKDAVSEFDVNIDPIKLIRSVKVCQDVYIRPRLGDELYFQLLNDFDSGSLSSDQLDLMKYVNDLLISRVCQRSLMFIHNQITNKGVQNRNSDYSTNTNETNVFRLINVYKSDSEFYDERLYNYLCNNKTKFPKWEDKSDDINPMNPDVDSYFGFMMI